MILTESQDYPPESQPDIPDIPNIPSFYFPRPVILAAINSGRRPSQPVLKLLAIIGFTPQTAVKDAEEAAEGDAAAEESAGVEATDVVTAKVESVKGEAAKEEAAEEEAA